MTERPIDSGWWLATDGNWYPPTAGRNGPPPTPAGWYADPCGGGQRYWDGGEWTAIVREADGSGPSSPRDALAAAIEALDRGERPVLAVPGSSGGAPRVDGSVVEMAARRPAPVAHTAPPVPMLPQSVPAAPSTAPSTAAPARAPMPEPAAVAVSGVMSDGIGELDAGAAAAWDAFVSLERPDDELDEAQRSRVFRRRRSA